MTIAEFESCPVGVKNKSDIEHLSKDVENISKAVDKRLDAVVQRIEEKIDSMDSKIQLEFSQMNAKIDSVNSKVDNLDKKVEVLDQKLDGVDNIDQYIEKKIESSQKDKVFNFVRWVVVGVLGTGAVTLFTTLITKLVK